MYGFRIQESLFYGVTRRLIHHKRLNLKFQINTNSTLPHRAGRAKQGEGQQIHPMFNSQILKFQILSLRLSAK